MGNSPDYKRSRIVMTLRREESPGAGGRGGCAVRLPGMPGFGNYVQAGGSDSAPAAVSIGCCHLALLPGGSAIPSAFAARAGRLLKQQERSPNSAALCCCVAPAITEQAWGDGPAGHPSPTTNLPTFTLVFFTSLSFTLVFCGSLSYRAGPPMLLGPSGPIYPLVSPMRDTDYRFPSVQSSKSHRFTCQKASSVKRLS